MAPTISFITAQYPGTCLTCDEEYGAGEKVWWCKGAGCWHEQCDAPRNIKPAKRSPLDAPEFGAAVTKPFKDDE